MAPSRGPATFLTWQRDTSGVGGFPVAGPDSLQAYKFPRRTFRQTASRDELQKQIEAAALPDTQSQARWLDATTLLIETERRGEWYQYVTNLFLFDCASATPRLLAVARRWDGDAGEESWGHPKNVRVSWWSTADELRLAYSLEVPARDRPALRFQSAGFLDAQLLAEPLSHGSTRTSRNSMLRS